MKFIWFPISKRKIGWRMAIKCKCKHFKLIWYGDVELKLSLSLSLVSCKHLFVYFVRRRSVFSHFDIIVTTKRKLNELFRSLFKWNAKCLEYLKDVRDWRPRERKMVYTKTLDWTKREGMLSLLSNHINLFLKHHIARKPNFRHQKSAFQVQNWTKGMEKKSEFVVLNISIPVLFFALSALYLSLTHSLTHFWSSYSNALVINCSACMYNVSINK